MFEKMHCRICSGPPDAEGGERFTPDPDTGPGSWDDERQQEIDRRAAEWPSKGYMLKRQAD